MSQTRTEVRYAREQAVFGAGGGWLTPENVLGAADGLAAAAGVPPVSESLGIYSLAFTIPDNGVPVAWAMRLLRHRGIIEPNNAYDYSLRFAQGQTPIGNDEADTITKWPKIWAWALYDGSRNADPMWGLSLTPGQIREQGTLGFGAIFRVQIGGTFPNALVDTIQVRLSYTLPNGWLGGFVGRRSASKFWFGS